MLGLSSPWRSPSLYITPTLCHRYLVMNGIRMPSITLDSMRMGVMKMRDMLARCG